MYEFIEILFINVTKEELVKNMESLDERFGDDFSVGDDGMFRYASIRINNNISGILKYISLNIKEAIVVMGNRETRLPIIQDRLISLLKTHTSNILFSIKNATNATLVGNYILKDIAYPKNLINDETKDILNNVIREWNRITLGDELVGDDIIKNIHNQYHYGVSKDNVSFWSDEYIISKKDYTPDYIKQNFLNTESKHIRWDVFQSIHVPVFLSLASKYNIDSDLARLVLFSGYESNTCGIWSVEQLDTDIDLMRQVDILSYLSKNQIGDKYERM